MSQVGHSTVHTWERLSFCSGVLVVLPTKWHKSLWWERETEAEPKQWRSRTSIRATSHMSRHNVAHAEIYRPKGARPCIVSICSIFERGFKWESGESHYRQWWLSHRCRMRKTTGVRLKLIEFAPDMKRDGGGDEDSDYNLTWLDHGRRCFLFMLEMFSSINYTYMIWEARKPCRQTGTLNLFLFVRYALGTTPQKRVSRTAVSA